MSERQRTDLVLGIRGVYSMGTGPGEADQRVPLGAGAGTAEESQVQLGDGQQGRQPGIPVSWQRIVSDS